MNNNKNETKSNKIKDDANERIKEIEKIQEKVGMRFPSILNKIRNHTEDELLEAIEQGIFFQKGVLNGIFGVSLSDCDIITLERMEAKKRSILNPEFEKKLELTIKKIREDPELDCFFDMLMRVNLI